MGSTRRRGALAGLVVACCACRAPTEITVVISTNLACDALDGTAVVVGAPADVEKKPAGTVTSSCDNGRIGSIVLLPGKDRDAGFVVKVVAGVGVLPEDCLTGAVRPTDVKGERGCIVARRELAFVPATPLTLPITMRRACIGVVCDAGSTCVEGGACVSAKVSDPMRCADPTGCDETSLGAVVGSGVGGGGSGGMSGGTGGNGGTTGSLGGAGGTAP